jgi:RHS repeat-associated protein
MVWALADRLGSIDLLADADGVVVDERTFDSFGRVLNETNPAVSFRYGYTGRERDLESGLDYYRARYYDSTVGRFISTDPMGFGAGDTNLYRYVGNNATNATDPTGMWSLQEAWNGAQQGWNNFTQGVAQGATSFRNTVTSNAQQGLEYWAGVAVAGQNEGGIIGDYKQRVGVVFGLLSSLATEDNIDKTNETLAIALGIARLGLNGLKGAAGGGTFGFGYGVADQLDRGKPITSINWQEVGDKTTVGLIGGAVGAVGFNSVATTLGSFIPANTLRFAGFGLGALGIGTQTGTAINHAGEGKWWTAGLDIATAGVGWLALHSSANKFTNQYEKMQQEAQRKLNSLLEPLTKSQRRKFSAAIVPIDTKTMQVGDARFSGLPVPSNIDPVLNQRSAQIGGVGSTGVTTAASSGNGKGNIVGACAEFHSGNDLLIKGSKIHNLKFTVAVQPRDPKTPVPTCANCQKIFKESFSLSENLVDKVMQNSIKKGN